VLDVFHGFLLYMVTPAKWQQLAPVSNRWLGGTLAGAAVVFFAYIGFDAVSRGGGTKDPRAILPIELFASLVICTIFNVVVRQSLPCHAISSAG